MALFANSDRRKLIYLFLFGLLFRLVLAWLPKAYFYYLISDDSYYYFSIAKNLVNRGMLSADGITLTNGFHPLWLFVITPVYLIFHSFPWFSIHLVITISACFDTAAAFFICKTLEKLGKAGIGFWAAGFYLINPYGLLHTMDGLETAQNNFFLALLVFLSIKATSEWLKSGWFLFGAVCGLALLSRTDSVFVIAVLWGYLFWRDRDLLSLLKTTAVASLLVLPWVIYNFTTFGTLVQTSGTSYPYQYHQQYLKAYHTYFSRELVSYLLKFAASSFTQNAFHYGNWVLTAIVAGILAFRLKNWPKGYRPLLWTLLAAGLFLAVHVFIRWSVRPWYPQAAFVLTLPVVALAFEKINPRLIAVGTIIILASSYWWFSKLHFRTGDRSLVMLDIIKKEIPADERVGAFNSGFLQYSTDRKVINLDGLINNEVLPYYKKQKGIEYLRKRDIRWLVDLPDYIGVVFAPFWGAFPESTFQGFKSVNDITYPGNNLVVVKVLPDSVRPVSGMEMPFWKNWVPRRDWKSIFYFPWR